MTTRKKAKRVAPRPRSRKKKAGVGRGVSAVQFLKKIDGPLTFGGLLSSIREGEEWSQSELGKHLGASKQHISDVERGQKSVSPERAATWARRLGYSEKLFVKLTLQAELERADLDYVVRLESA